PRTGGRCRRAGSGAPASWYRREWVGRGGSLPGRPSASAAGDADARRRGPAELLLARARSDLDDVQARLQPAAQGAVAAVVASAASSAASATRRRRDGRAIVAAAVRGERMRDEDRPPEELVVQVEKHPVGRRTSFAPHIAPSRLRDRARLG